MNEEILRNLAGYKVNITDAFGNTTGGTVESVQDGVLLLNSRWEGKVYIAIEYIAKLTVSK